MRSTLVTLAIGIGATLCIDLWAMLLRRFGVQSLSYCLLGRWVLHMPSGKVMHDGIGRTAAKRHECLAGWTAHYAIGVTFAFVFLQIVSAEWLANPTVVPALLFGAASVIVPFFTIQPAFGLGIASSRAPNPAAARLKSLGTHTVFGAGLYAGAALIARA
jgi:hypothetical protein